MPEPDELVESRVIFEQEEETPGLGHTKLDRLAEWGIRRTPTFG